MRRRWVGPQADVEASFAMPSAQQRRDADLFLADLLGEPLRRPAPRRRPRLPTLRDSVARAALARFRPGLPGLAVEQEEAPAAPAEPPRDLPAAAAGAAAAAQNVLFFPSARPTAPARVRVDVLAHLQGGLVTDGSLRARVSAIIGPGATLRGLAARLAPLFASATAPATAAPGAATPPTTEELARALLVYSRYYLPVTSFNEYRVGLRLPLPIEIDQTNGDWIVNPNTLRLWAGTFDATAWTRLLDQAPAALTVPTSADLDARVAALRAAEPTPLGQGIALLARALRNPFDTIGLATRLFQTLGGAGAFNVALELMNSAVNHQLRLLSSLIPGDALIRQLRAVLSQRPAGLTPAAETNRQRALRMLLPTAVGWAPPIRADELGPGGTDRLAERTFDCGELSVFVPAGAAATTTNRVHVFFSPGGVTSASGGNAVAVHGLRGSADRSEWIVIGVRGEPGRAFTISSAEIVHCLQLIGRPAQIDIVRMSAHSRGNGSLAATLNRRLITPLALIDHVTVLDGSDFASSLTTGFRASSVPASKITSYDVNTGTFPLAGVQNIHIDAGCIRSIGYARLINDGIATGRAAGLGSAVAARVAALPLPARGLFSTVSPAPAGMTNLAAFCTDTTRSAAITDMRRGEANVAHPSALASSASTSPYAAIEFGNLMNFNDPGAARTTWTSFGAGIYSHHLFVAEIARELFP